MIRIILLLSPIFVTLFWAIALIGNKKEHSTPRLFLSKFMLFPLICLLAHFSYFAPLPDIYPYLDFPYQYAGSLILPVYYIYFRLLTVEDKFSFKAHARYLAVPAFLASLYCIGAVLTPGNEYRTWLYNEHAFPNSPYIQFLSTMRTILRIQFLVLGVSTVIGNHLLIRKYRDRAEQFYSDINDGKYNNAKMLNYSILIIAGAAFVGVALGRRLLMSKDTIIYIVWSITTVMMYIIGYMGFKQKPINPTFESQATDNRQNLLEAMPDGAPKNILNKILAEFNEKKIHLNSQLNITDLAQAIGTNRTYISSVINQQYNQNFCTFVNTYRIQELEQVLLENPDYSNEMLAEYCGFGSVISLRRAVSAKTGLSMNEWKKHHLSKE
jgi:AraC-like DNA-binding protein